MPLRKYRRVEDIPVGWISPGEPALYRAIEALWEFGRRTTALRFPPGVYKHRSIEALSALEETWAEANFRAFHQRKQN